MNPSGANGCGHYFPHVCLATHSRLPPASTKRAMSVEKGPLIFWLDFLRFRIPQLALLVGQQLLFAL